MLACEAHFFNNSWPVDGQLQEVRKDAREGALFGERVFFFFFYEGQVSFTSNGDVQETRCIPGTLASPGLSICVLSVSLGPSNAAALISKQLLWAGSGTGPSKAPR